MHDISQFHADDEWVAWLSDFRYHATNYSHEWRSTALERRTKSKKKNTCQRTDWTDCYWIEGNDISRNFSVPKCNTASAATTICVALKYTFGFLERVYSSACYFIARADTKKKKHLVLRYITVQRSAVKSCMHTSIIAFRITCYTVYRLCEWEKEDRKHKQIAWMFRNKEIHLSHSIPKIRKYLSGIKICSQINNHFGFRPMNCENISS